jgi:SAM-dependent methyltransferase
VTLPPSYFDELYLHHEDPWGFRDRSYERRKRALTLACLPADHYGTVLEPGCSIGVLTAGLAERADRVVAMDVSAASLRSAASHLPAAVELRLGAVPGDWPDGRWDLVVLSEVGYYLRADDWRATAGLAVRTAGDLIAVHWRHPVDDYPLGGDEVHHILGVEAAAAGMHLLVSHVEEDLRAEVWSADRRSVARRTGLLAPGSA